MYILIFMLVKVIIQFNILKVKIVKSMIISLFNNLTFYF